MRIKYRIADISHHNNIVDPQVFFDDNYMSGVIIRAGYGTKTDNNFVKHLELALQYRVPFCIYWYSYAITVEELKKEINYVMDLFVFHNIPIYIPLFFDFEDADGKKGKRGYTIDIQSSLVLDFIKLMCDNNLSRRCGIYMSASDFIYFDQNYSMQLSAEYYYLRWVARWNGISQVPNCMFDIWQYTNQAQVNGSMNSTDLSTCSDYIYHMLFADIAQKLYYVSADEKEPVKESSDDLLSGKYTLGEVLDKLYATKLIGV